MNNIPKSIEGRGVLTLLLCCLKIDIEVVGQEVCLGLQEEGVEQFCITDMLEQRTTRLSRMATWCYLTSELSTAATALT